MLQKLKCVIVDDDKCIIELLSELFRGIPYVSLSNSFDNPSRFLEALPVLDFDVCLMDVAMKGTDDLFVAKQIKDRQVIFVTGQENIARVANAYSPTDIVLKPIDRYKLNDALTKAYYNVSYGENKKVSYIKEYVSFNVNNGQGKVVLKLADLLFAHSDDKDPRNKRVLMRNGETHLLMNCTFEYLLAIAPGLVRINGSEVVLLELIKNYGHDVITIDFPIEKDKIKQLTLSRAFKKEFQNRVSFI